jgi:CCR4-NOT transcription complex subunit 1
VCLLTLFFVFLAIKPSNLLKDRKRYSGPNPVDFRPQQGGEEIPSQLETEFIEGPSLSAPLPPPTQQPQTPLTSVPPEIVTFIQLLPLIQINTTIPLPIQLPVLKRYVLIAIQRAIQEILNPVVEHSVAIACVTTREVVLKDFVMELDETKVLRAACAMVQSLARNYALATCKGHYL